MHWTHNEVILGNYKYGRDTRSVRTATESLNTRPPGANLRAQQ
jgi:hypothetical protein